MAATNEVPVQEYTQDFSWSCGPAALKILMSRYGHNVSEDQLIKLSNTQPVSGATHEGLIKAAKLLGYKVIAKPGASINDLTALVKLNIPVMVDFQARHGGHFAVVTAVKDGRIFLEDPRREGASHHSLDINVFLARWYNITYKERRLIQNWMMAIVPA